MEKVAIEEERRNNLLTCQASPPASDRKLFTIMRPDVGGQTGSVLIIGLQFEEKKVPF